MKIDLPTSLTFPEDTICYLTDISIPVSWYTVDKSRNKFDFQINSDNYVRTIQSSNYSTTTLNYILVAILNNIMTNKLNSTPDIGNN